MADETKNIIIQAVDKTKPGFDSVKGGLKGIGNEGKATSTLLSNLLPAATIAGVVAGLKNMADTALAYGEAVDKVADITGLSAEKSSELVVQARHVGVAVETVANGMGILAKNIGDNNKAFDEYNIKTKTATGEMLPLEQVLAQIRQREAEMGEGMAATRMEMALFGKSGKELHDFLAANSDEMERVTQKAKELGLILDDLSKDNLEQAKRELNDYKMIQESLALNLSEEVIPNMIILEGWLVKIARAFNAITGAGAMREMAASSKALDAANKNTILSQLKLTVALHDQKKVSDEILAANVAYARENTKASEAEIQAIIKTGNFLVKKEEEGVVAKKKANKAKKDDTERTNIDETRITEKAGKAMSEEMERRNKKDRTTLVGGWRWALDQLRNQSGETAIDMGRYFISAFNTISDSLRGSIAGWVRGTKSVGDVFQTMIDSVKNAWINLIAEMITQWLTSKIAQGLPVALTTVGNAVGSAANAIAGRAGDFGGQLGEAVTEFATGKSSIRGEIGDAWNQLGKGDVGGALVSVGQGIADFFTGRWFAKGGIATQATAGVFGEKGREALIPLDDPQAKSMLAGVGGETHYHFHVGAFMGNKADALAFAKEVQKNLDVISRRNLTT